MIVKMPKFGLQMTSGFITEWKVLKGQRVSAGDILFTVETDKLVNEVESPCAGVVVDLFVQEGDEVDVGAYCCNIS